MLQTLQARKLLVWVCCRAATSAEQTTQLTNYQKEHLEARCQDWSVDTGKPFPKQGASLAHVYVLTLLQFDPLFGEVADSFDSRPMSCVLTFQSKS